MQQLVSPTHSFRPLGLALMGTVIGLAFCWLAFRQVDWNSVGNALSAVTWGGIVLALLLKVGSDIVRAARWRCLLTEHKVSVSRLYVVETAAVGLNNVSPVHILDEPLLLALLTIRDRLPAGTVLATMVMTRVQDLTFTILFAALSVVLVPGIVDLAWPMILTSPALILVLLAIFNLRWLIYRFPLLERIPMLVSFSTGVTDLKKRPKRLALSFCLTAGYWCMLGPAAVALGRSMGIDLSVYQMLVVVLGSIFFGTAMPSLPGGIGPFDWAVVTLLGIWNVDRETALGFALLLHLLLFVPSTVVAALALPREGLGSLKALRQLTGQKHEDVETTAL